MKYVRSSPGRLSESSWICRQNCCKQANRCLSFLTSLILWQLVLSSSIPLFTKSLNHLLQRIYYAQRLCCSITQTIFIKFKNWNYEIASFNSSTKRATTTLFLCVRKLDSVKSRNSFFCCPFFTYEQTPLNFWDFFLSIGTRLQSTIRRKIAC